MSSERIWWQSSTSLDVLPILKTYAESLQRHARRILPSNFEIVVRGVSRGTFEVDHPYFEHLNNLEIIENLYKAQKEGYTAIAVGCFLDPGVREIRTIADIPVLGIAESAMLTACMLGRKFAIVTHTPNAIIKKFSQMIREYGLSKRVAPTSCINVSMDDLAKAFENPKPIITEFLSVSEKVVQQKTEIIIPNYRLLNMVLAENKISHLPGGKIPILDATGALLKQIEALITLRRVSNLTVSRAGYYAKPTNVEEVRGIYGLK